MPTEITEVPAPEGTGPETEWQQLDVTVARDSLGWTPRRTRIRARGGAIGDRFRRGTFAGLATGRANAFGALRLLLAATVVVSH
ncbi:hypothetical protein PUR71_05185, partial [Streptomyces sp. SP17BM10]|nr:hypothetical protein [Streptomyces sp. SP17BM10]